VEQGEPICTVYFNSDKRLPEALKLIKEAYHISTAARYMPQPLIHRVIEAGPKQPAEPVEADNVPEAMEFLGHGMNNGKE
jgi:hypothetical protein